MKILQKLCSKTKNLSYQNYLSNVTFDIDLYEFFKLPPEERNNYMLKDSHMDYKRHSKLEEEKKKEN